MFKNLYSFFFEAISDLRTFLWFLLKGPKFYTTFLEYTLRKFRQNNDSEYHLQQALDWCQNHKIELGDLYDQLNIQKSSKPVFEKEFIDEKQEIIFSSNSDFGGMGHAQLLYDISQSLDAKICIETGVAYGWSSEAILRHLSINNGYLYSIDMPMIGQADYELIGFVVSEKNQPHWKLFREPDRNGLLKAIKLANTRGGVDLVHYDSDKSYYGRSWSQPIIYKSLRKGGYFISDDIEDNLAFKEFVEENNYKFFVVEFQNKYVGIVPKL
jgi:predicted O-methyltransferase YrrM